MNFYNVSYCITVVFYLKVLFHTICYDHVFILPQLLLDPFYLLTCPISCSLSPKAVNKKQTKTHQNLQIKSNQIKQTNTKKMKNMVIQNDMKQPFTPNP